MTATDELRLILDEHGVEYRTHGTTDRTWFEVGRISWFIYERENGDFTANAVLLTPEQAIDATLVREPDDAATSKLHDRMNATLLEYERALGSEKADGAITVPFVVEMHHLLEEAATLGVSDATGERQGVAGTCRADETDVIKCWVKCKNEPSTEHLELIHVMECSACGGTYEYVNGGYEYCPRCGAKVVVE